VKSQDSSNANRNSFKSHLLLLFSFLLAFVTVSLFREVWIWF